MIDAKPQHARPNHAKQQSSSLIHAFLTGALLFAAPIFTTSLATPAAAANVKMATLVPQGSVWDRILRDMGNEWREATNGEEALAEGLVTALHDDPLAAAMEAAAAIRTKSPDAIRGMKQLFNAAWRLSDAEALAMEAKVQLGVMGKKNQLEAVMANLQKRVPNFDD